MDKFIENYNQLNIQKKLKNWSSLSSEEIKFILLCPKEYSKSR